MLLRVPGLGTRSVARLLQARRARTLRIDDLARLNVPLKKVLPFIAVPGHGASSRQLDAASLPATLRPAARQQALFDG
jgi:predicted DNA-binding helix-hairpin-helix protein